MASKRLAAAVPKASISSPLTQTQTVSQPKPKTPPPSPPPAITLKDLQEALKKNALDIKEEVADLLDCKMASERAVMAELLEAKNKEMREDIILAFQGLAMHIERIDDKLEEVTENAARLESRVEEVEDKIDMTQDELIISQYRDMEFALRIRGMKENQQEDLKEVISKDIAFNLGWKPEEIWNEIEKIFRVNSWVARQRNLPRDVVIYFSRRSIRNEILQAFYKQKFQIAAQEVMILKEIPPKILRRRKDFAFLSDELKRRQIQFRWEIPTGIAVIYEGKRYRLTTVSKAEEFYNSVLKASSSLSLQASKIEEEQIIGGATSVIVREVQGQYDVQNLEIKEQRLTRAAYKRREKQKNSEKTVVTTTTEPVGGARPKRSSTIDLQVMLQRLQVGKDGKAPDMEC